MLNCKILRNIILVIALGSITLSMNAQVSRVQVGKQKQKQQQQKKGKTTTVRKKKKRAPTKKAAPTPAPVAVPAFKLPKPEYNGALKGYKPDVPKLVEDLVSYSARESYLTYNNPTRASSVYQLTTKGKSPSLGAFGFGPQNLRSRLTWTTENVSHQIDFSADVVREYQVGYNIGDKTLLPGDPNFIGTVSIVKVNDTLGKQLENWQFPIQPGALLISMKLNTNDASVNDWRLVINPSVRSLKDVPSTESIGFLSNDNLFVLISEMSVPLVPVAKGTSFLGYNFHLVSERNFQRKTTQVLFKDGSVESFDKYYIGGVQIKTEDEQNRFLWLFDDSLESFYNVLMMVSLTLSFNTPSPVVYQ